MREVPCLPTLHHQLGLESEGEIIRQFKKVMIHTTETIDCGFFRISGHDTYDRDHREQRSLAVSTGGPLWIAVSYGLWFLRDCGFLRISIPQEGAMDEDGDTPHHRRVAQECRQECLTRMPDKNVSAARYGSAPALSRTCPT